MSCEVNLRTPSFRYKTGTINGSSYFKFTHPPEDLKKKKMCGWTLVNVANLRALVDTNNSENRTHESRSALVLSRPWNRLQPGLKKWVAPIFFGEVCIISVISPDLLDRHPSHPAPMASPKDTCLSACCTSSTQGGKRRSASCRRPLPSFGSVG